MMHQQARVQTSQSSAYQQNQNTKQNNESLQSEMSDDGCDDVDEMLVISQNMQKNMDQQINIDISGSQHNTLKETTNQKHINQLQNMSSQHAQQNMQSNKQQMTFNSSVQQQENQQVVVNHEKGPEMEKDFKKAYFKLVHKLGQEEGAHLLIPSDDLAKFATQPKVVTVEELQNKITSFEDKKRQKIQFMKEEKAQKEVEECIFTPQLLTKKRNEPSERRNIDKFLEDQKRFEEMKRAKLVERQEEHVKSQISQTLRGPYINEKSKRLLEQRQFRVNSQQKIEDLTSPFDQTKLNHITSKISSATKFKDNSVTRLSQPSKMLSDQKRLFQPEITQKSRDIVRQEPVEDILYREAARRKVKLQEREREIYKPHEKQVNKETNKIVFQKFYREFNQALVELFSTDQSKVPGPDTQVPKAINYLSLKQLIVKLGFCTDQAANSDSNERVLLYDIWRLLEGDQKEEISIEDLKILIMAVVKITDHRRINVLPNEDEQENVSSSSVGFFNSKNQYCLRPEDLPIIQKQFDLLYVNRIQHFGRVAQEKKQQQKSDQMSFKPQLNQKTEAIAQNYRHKIASQINEEKIQTFEWLSAVGNKEEWRQNAKQVVEKEELKECTFKPQINQASRELSSQRQSVMKKGDREDSGDRFNELYGLAKRLQQRPRTDKTSEEIEFEKAKEQCTFIPNCKRVSSDGIPLPQPNKHISDDRHVQKEVERMRKAREEKERVKKFTERGIVLQENPKPQMMSRPQTSTHKTSTSKVQSFANQSSPQIPNKKQKQPEQFSRTTQNMHKSLNNFNPINSYNDLPRQQQQSKQQQRSVQESPMIQPEQPLLFIDINLGEESSERIVVFEGDSAKDLAQKFCDQHNLDEETQIKLEEQLAAQIRSVLSKIDEESELRIQE